MERRTADADPREALLNRLIDADDADDADALRKALEDARILLRRHRKTNDD